MSLAGLPKKTVALVWAEAQNKVIGLQGEMPWFVPEDLKHFNKLTRHQTVIMGRKTWDSLPAHVRPLPSRQNFILSSNSDYIAEGATVFVSLEAAIAAADSDTVWVMGGGKVYEAALPFADRIEVTQIDVYPNGDAFAPQVPDEFALASSKPENDSWSVSSSGLRFRMLTFNKALES